MDRRDYIDPDEGRPEPFYAIAEPCEGCGKPTYNGRYFDAAYQLWIGVDCACNAPQQPTCPLLVAEFPQGLSSIREICRVIRAHRKTCHLCRGVVEIRPTKETRREPATTQKEAA